MQLSKSNARPDASGLAKIRSKSIYLVDLRRLELLTP